MKGYFDNFSLQMIIFKALSSSGEGSRTLTVICESAVNADTLNRVEALRRAHTIHALPASVTPNSNNPHLLESKVITNKYNIF